jgi:tRNA threonylcarbamoyladenosine biosynthesis protein TsaE
LSEAGNILSAEVISHSPEETQTLGKKLGERAQSGDLFLLVGALGSGKTCFAQGIAWGLAIKDYASSPSFVLIKEYQGRLPFFHLDFYRLDKIEEIIDLGLYDYLSSRPGVCVVEWAEKGLAVFPAERLLIKLSFASETERLFHFKPEGERYINLVAELCNWQ